MEESINKLASRAVIRLRDDMGQRHGKECQCSTCVAIGVLHGIHCVVQQCKCDEIRDALEDGSSNPEGYLECADKAGHLPDCPLYAVDYTVLEPGGGPTCAECGGRFWKGDHLTVCSHYGEAVMRPGGSEPQDMSVQ